MIYIESVAINSDYNSDYNIAQSSAIRPPIFTEMKIKVTNAIPAGNERHHLIYMTKEILEQEYDITWEEFKHAFPEKFL